MHGIASIAASPRKGSGGIHDHHLINLLIRHATFFQKRHEGLQQIPVTLAAGVFQAAQHTDFFRKQNPLNEPLSDKCSHFIRADVFRLVVEIADVIDEIVFGTPLSVC